MEVLLVRPPINQPGSTPLVYISHPLGLCSLAAYLKKHGIHAAIHDGMAIHERVEKTIRTCIERNPDLVGFTVKSFQLKNACRISTELKKWRPEISIIHGGNHISADPTMSLENGADICVLGEGEETLYEIVRFLQEGGKVRKDIERLRMIPGIAFMDGNRIVRTEPRKQIEDLDLLPPPDWSLVDHRHYIENIHVDPAPAIQVMASRGCKHNCYFCSTGITWGHRVRYRSPESVFEELRSDRELHGFDRFHFYDDDILTDPSWMKEFAELVLKKGFKSKWICLARPESIVGNADLLWLMKQAGCQGIEFGYENGSDVMYDNMGKDVSRSMVWRAIEVLMSHDFPMVEMLLMVFYEGETLQSLMSTWEDMWRIHEHWQRRFVLNIFFATPFPGTCFYRRFPESGELLYDDYDYLDAHFVNYLPNSFLASKTADASISKDALACRLRMFFPGRYCLHNYEKIKTFFREISITSFSQSFVETWSEVRTVGDVVNDLWQRYESCSGMDKKMMAELVSNLIFQAAKGKVMRPG